MTTSTIQLTGTRVLLDGPLRTEADIDAMLGAAFVLEQFGAHVLYPLSPKHPANDPAYVDGADFDAVAAAALDAECIEAAQLVVVLPGWEECGDVIVDVLAAEAAGVAWVEFARLPI
ncbi:MAG: hypothetical protein ACT4QG_12860 [Sporichthyaceae bacterium]